MAGRKEGCASIGCLGFCIVFVTALWLGSPQGDDAPPVSPSPVVTPAPQFPQPEPRQWLYVHDTLSVRAEPASDAQVVRTLRRGDMVQVGPRDAGGWARLYTGAAGDEYVYRDSDLLRADPPLPVLPPADPPRPQRQLHVGPRGGCYYLGDGGDKTYVDRSECNGIAQPLVAPGASGGSSRRSGGGRELHIGPRGGCYYINSNGNKTYVDRSQCY